MAPLVCATFSALVSLPAFAAGIRTCVDRLLSAGADPNVRWHDPQLADDPLSALYGAAGRNHDVAITRRLLQAGADLHATDAQGLTPLHCATLYGFTSRDRPRLVALLDALLLAGADPQQAAAGGVTPLLLLLSARAVPGTPCIEEVVLAGLERLFDEEVRLDARDQRGDMFRRCFLQHTVPQIEDKRLAAHLVHKRIHSPLHRRAACHKQQRIEIALNGHVEFGHPILRCGCINRDSIHTGFICVELIALQRRGTWEADDLRAR
jgi:hypothetical protein